jgi:dihydrofolate reductase
VPKVEANGITINYEQQGDGEPLILIPYTAADNACYAFPTPQVLLMGRVTYEALSGIAQNHPVEGPDRMSELPKVVFSRTLREPLAWDNSRVAKANLVEEVRRLKAESDAPLRTIGSLLVVKALLEARMVDRLRLTVFPLILGSTGREPVFAGLPDIHLELVDTEVLDARLVTLEYRPATAQQTD